MQDQEHKVKDSRHVPSPPLIWYGYTQRLDPTKAMSCTQVSCAYYILKQLQNGKSCHHRCARTTGETWFIPLVCTELPRHQKKGGRGRTGEKRLVTVEESEDSDQQ